MRLGECAESCLPDPFRVIAAQDTDSGAPGFEPFAPPEVDDAAPSPRAAIRPPDVGPDVAPGLLWGLAFVTGNVAPAEPLTGSDVPLWRTDADPAAPPPRAQGNDAAPAPDEAPGAPETTLPLDSAVAPTAGDVLPLHADRATRAGPPASRMADDRAAAPGSPPAGNGAESRRCLDMRPAMAVADPRPADRLGALHAAPTTGESPPALQAPAGGPHRERAALSGIAGERAVDVEAPAPGSARPVRGAENVTGALHRSINGNAPCADIERPGVEGAAADGAVGRQALGGSTRTPAAEVAAGHAAALSAGARVSIAIDSTPMPPGQARPCDAPERTKGLSLALATPDTPGFCFTAGAVRTVEGLIGGDRRSEAFPAGTALGPAARPADAAAEGTAAGQVVELPEGRMEVRTAEPAGVRPDATPPTGREGLHAAPKASAQPRIPAVVTLPATEATRLAAAFDPASPVARSETAFALEAPRMEAHADPALPAAREGSAGDEPAAPIPPAGGDGGTTSVSAPAADSMALQVAEAAPRGPLDPTGADASSAVPSARQETAVGAVQQVAAAMSLAPDGSVELLLDPAELGPVRLGLSGGEGGLSVHITAERPETLDLFRRHADLLARDLRAAGYGGVTFQFGGDTPSQDTRAGAHGYEPAAGARREDAAAGSGTHRHHAPTSLRRAHAGGLDLRL